MSLRLYLFFIIFSFSFLDWIILIGLPFILSILSFSSSHLLLRPSDKLFISDVVLYNSRIFIWFIFCDLYLFIDIICLMRHHSPTFPYFSLNLSIDFFSPLNIFTIASLKCLSHKFNIRASSWTISIDSSVYWVQDIASCFLTCLLVFFVVEILWGTLLLELVIFTVGLMSFLG